MKILHAFTFSVLRCSALTKNDAFFERAIRRGVELVTVIFRNRAREGIARIERLVVSLNENLSVQLVRSRLRQNLDTAVTKPVIFC